jgi:ribosomal protein L20A (L18A)
LIAAATGIPAAAFSYETDQFSNREDEIADSTEILNAKVNESIAKIVANWNKGHDEMALVDAIYRDIGGRHWVDKLERWAMKSDEVEKLDTPRYDSVFSGLPWYALRVTTFFGVGKTIRLNGQLVGSDKIGHFLSQGRKFYKRYRKSLSESEAAEHSAYTESAIFGQLTTSSYSNADLVANYEGHRFYRSLFEDDIVPGKSAILGWGTGGWVIRREFDWADHVNAYWDEALNINYFGNTLQKHMRERLLTLCPLYDENPQLYMVENEAELQEKYAHLAMRDNQELRLENLCSS